MQLSPLGVVLMAGWIPVVLLFFAALPPRRAVLISFIGAWLFLPMAGWYFSGLPDYTKASATSMGAILGVLLFDPNRLLKFRFHWLDVPMAIWCGSPFLASVTNNLGAYDGFSEALNQTVAWGLPYFIGRIYFSDLQGLRELTAGVFIGGLLYVPFCWYEIRFSPQLHRIVYGFYQHDFAQTIRFGGYRPMVFMQHGLMVGMWMAMATLAGIWLAWTGVGRRIMGISAWWWVVLLGGTAVWCKSAFALFLLLLGCAGLAAVRFWSGRWLVAVLAVVPICYMVLRQTDVLSRDLLVDSAAAITNAERADSLRFRLDQERLFSARAWEKPAFGWGGWQRAFPEERENVASRAVDSQWLIAFGQNGLLGLSALIMAFALPVCVLARRAPGPAWRHPLLVGLVVTALQVTLYAIDNLLNAMNNPVFLLGLGGLTGLVTVMRPSMFATPASVATPMRYPQASLASNPQRY